MIDRGVIELNAQFSTPGFYFIGCEIGAVIGDDAVWNAITVHDTGYEVYHWSGFDRLTGLASIHLVNLSTMTSRYFFLWLPPLRGPPYQAPRPQKAK